MDRSDPFDKGPVRRPLEEEVGGGDSALAEDVDHIEHVEDARTDEALDQDPEKVPNRIQEPEPPREEEVRAKG